VISLGSPVVMPTFTWICWFGWRGTDCLKKTFHVEASNSQLGDVPLDLRFDGYRIVKYRPEFKEDILKLQTSMWGPNLETNAAYLEWKYHNNPYVQTPTIYIALWNGKVVGMRGMFSTKWEVGQPAQPLSCSSSSDALVHPDHRRRGLLKEMTIAALEELADSSCKYIISLSTNRFSFPALLKLGWRSVGFVQTAHWRAYRGRDSALRRFARKLPFLPSAYRRLRKYGSRLFSRPLDRSSPFDALDKNAAQACQDNAAYVSVQKAPRPEAMAELVGRIGYDGRIRHIRDQQFFAWRFQNPLSLYRFLFWEESGLCGYLILQASVYATDSMWIHIADWEATNTRVRTGLLQAAIQWGDFGGLTIWSATLPGKVKVLLKNRGFNFWEEINDPMRDVRRPTVLVRPVRQEMPQTDWFLGDLHLLELANWDLRQIYSDNF
jgi:GNAT superfamily N-acetyltransferase